MPPPDLSHTFCSSVAAMADIAAQRRKICGASRLSVWLTKPSVQEANFRRPAPFIAGLVVFEAIGILLSVIVPPVETGFAVERNEKRSVVAERDGDLELGEDLGDDGVFEVFGVLDCEGVVVVEH